MSLFTQLGLQKNERNRRRQLTHSFATHDPELPSGWEEDFDSDGNTFYLNRVKGITQWDHPGWLSTPSPGQ